MNGWIEIDIIAMQFKEAAHPIDTTLQSKNVPGLLATRQHYTCMLISDLIKTKDLPEATEGEIRKVFKRVLTVGSSLEKSFYIGIYNLCILSETK